MSVIRTAIAFTALLLGALCLLIAFANLYNVDEQPRTVIAGYALVGLVLLMIGVIVVRGARRSSKPAPPAP